MADNKDVDRLARWLLGVLAAETTAPEDALCALAEAQRLLALSALRHVGWSWLGAADLVDDLAYLLARRVLAVVREETADLLPQEVLGRAAGCMCASRRLLGPMLTGPGRNCSATWFGHPWFDSGFTGRGVHRNVTRTYGNLLLPMFFQFGIVDGAPRSQSGDDRRWSLQPYTTLATHVPGAAVRQGGG